MDIKYCINHSDDSFDYANYIGEIMKTIGIFNLTDEKINEIEHVEKILEFASEKENLSNIEFNCIIVDDHYIRQLNKEYRNIDKVTDVITFALEDEELITNDDIRLLGDIYISLPKAKKQAQEYGHALKRELTFLAVHGFYHLLGYDHMNESDEKIMIKKQEEVLSNYEKRNV